jgi:mitochondrial FAD-linked sulfhydryl oxidase
MIGYHQLLYQPTSLSYSQERQESVPLGTKISKDCEIPACNSTKEMMKLARQKRKELQSQPPQQLLQQNPYKPGCPVLREQLGASTWNLIHTIAANYPDEPTEIDKDNVKKFFQTLSYLYPCPHCAEDFQKAVTSKPPE